MKIFNLYRSGYNLGNADGREGRHHKAVWQLLLFNPLTWLLFVDAASYVNGYAEGYRDGIFINRL